MAVALSSQTTTPEQSFRSSLEDVVVVLEKLSPFATSPEELAGMVRLALENEGQLRLLFQITTQGKR